MKAVRIHAHGGPEVLRIETMADPVPRPDQVLIRIRACALNRLDIWVREGIRRGVRLPVVPGSDIAGDILAVGSVVTGLTPGQRVLVVPGISCMQCPTCLAGRHNLCPEARTLGAEIDGGCAELIAVPAVNAFPLPESLTYEEGAAVPMVFLTAWHQVLTRGGLQPGENVLIWGATSGVGTAAIQIARLFGGRVLAVAGGPERCRRVLDLGADVAIDYRSQDVAAAVTEHTDGRGVELVIDNIGQEAWAASLEVMALGARYVTVSTTTGAVVPADLGLFLRRSYSLMGSRAGTKGEFAALLPLLAAGVLRPVIHSTMPLSAVAAAHRVLDERGTFGKVVLTV